MCVEIHMPQDVYIYDPNVPVPKYVQHVEIPEGPTFIKNYAFNDCTRLRSITIPDSVTKIGDSAFEKCTGLQSVTIPDGVTEIGEYAFYGCSALQSVTMPDSVTEIGDRVFCNCSGLQSVTMPNGITEIKEETFLGCSGLQSVTIPDSVTAISKGAFDGCSALQSVTIPDGVKTISKGVFRHCSGLRSVAIPNGIMKIDNNAFTLCPALQSLLYEGINTAPFININGYGVNTFNVIKTLITYRISLNENIIMRGIDMQHRGRLLQWVQEYPIFGEMRLPPAMKSVDEEIKERLRQCFAVQERTKRRIPEILDKLSIAARACGIPPERLAEAFDIEYTKNLLGKTIPLVPAEACRCYYDRNICNMLIRKEKISVMAETISFYNESGHKDCYRHAMEFIRLHPDTKTEDLRYVAEHAEKIPMRAETTLTQIRQYRTYMENLAEVTKIEEEYGETVPGFKLSDYPCNIEPVSITYNGMTARVLDLSEDRDIALAAGLGELTNCCQSLGKAGETAMMHGFLNPDAGFWVIEDRDGKVKAQAEIWKSDKGILVFDNIEFADTDDEHLAHRIEQLRGVIAAWAMESGYENIIMGCGYNELGTDSMEQAPVPELRLTPEEVFALQKDNEAEVSFENIDAVHRYMQSEEYSPDDFVYTDANEQCVYIRKNGTVSDYLMQGYDERLAGGRNPHEQSLPVEKADGISM